MKKYRIGIVGSGGIARRHTDGYRAVAGDLGEIVAACDINQETLDKYCETYNVPLKFTNPKDLIESGEVDVISLLTPPAVRSEVIFPAFKHGIHILVEKPFTEKMSDAIAFVEAAEKAGVVLAVNQQMRFMPEMLKAREIIKSGEIGQVRFVAHDSFQNRTSTRGWRKDEERLEISIFSIHVLDRLRWLMGRPPEAVSAVMRYWDKEVRGETFTALTVQFEDGMMATMVSNWHSMTIPECRLRIDGTEGTILLEKSSVSSDQCKLKVHTLGGDPKEYDCSRSNNSSLAVGDNMKNLIQAAESGTQPINSGRDNLETMAIVDGAYLSASRGGAKVDISEVWKS